jgi:hypothetical protein
MSWRAITEDDIYSAINAAEATALRAALQRPGQEDPLDTLIQQVTGYARDAIRSCSRNRLHPTATYLPEGVIPQAVDIILYRIGLRLSRALPIDESRREAKRSAESYFDKVASCSRQVESYGDDESGTPQTIEVSSSTPDRQWSRSQQSGL